MTLNLRNLTIPSFLHATEMGFILFECFWKTCSWWTSGYVVYLMISRCHLQMWSTVFNLKKLGYVSNFLLTLLQTKRMKGGNCSARTQIFFTRSKVSRKKQRTLNSKLRYVFIEKTCWNVCREASIMTWLFNRHTYRLSCTFFFFQLFHSEKVWIWKQALFMIIGKTGTVWVLNQVMIPCESGYDSMLFVNLNLKC